MSHVLDEADGALGYSYRARGGLVVAALASHLEGNIVGGVALDLDGTGREVVEVLVEQLEEERSVSRTLSRELALTPAQRLVEVSGRAKAGEGGGAAELTSLADLEMSEKAGIDILVGGEGGRKRPWNGKTKCLVEKLNDSFPKG